MQDDGLTSLQMIAWFLVLSERARQDEKWGPPTALPKDRPPERWLAIFMEEAGELAAEVTDLGGIDEWPEEVVVDLLAEEAYRTRLKKELVETIATGLSWLEWIIIRESEDD